jgi:hypothetical protein
MKQYIRITMSKRSFRMGDGYPADYQLPSFHQLVEINAKTDFISTTHLKIVTVYSMHPGK